jgi:hypothetical protein
MMRRLARTPGQNRTAGRSIHRLGAGSVGASFALASSVTPDPLVGGKPSWQTVSADGNGPAAGPARHGVSSRSGRYGQVGLIVVRARSHDRTPLVFSRAIEL